MDLYELIRSINIVEFIGQFTDLEQRGEEFWGLSPLKEEKTPSFSVKEDPPFFYDYSSGASGNVFGFVKAYYKCSNAEAVNILKRYAGVDGKLSGHSSNNSAVSVMKRYLRRESQKKESSGVVLPDDYMERYERRLDKLKVWLNEGISIASIDRFQVRYDGYSNRIVYPVRDLDSRIINVGNRALDEHWKELGERKYGYFFPFGQINTIYGLSENRQFIKEAGEVVLFEGCKSVLLADTWGIKNTGAILTSHLSSNQMRILAKLGVNVVFALDKEVRIKDDKNIQKLKKFVNVFYLWDKADLLDEKDAPVDKGEAVFRGLYEEKLRLR